MIWEVKPSILSQSPRKAQEENTRSHKCSRAVSKSPIPSRTFNTLSAERNAEGRLLIHAGNPLLDKVDRDYPPYYSYNYIQRSALEGGIMTDVGEEMIREGIAGAYPHQNVIRIEAEKKQTTNLPSTNDNVSLQFPLKSHHPIPHHHHHNRNNQSNYNPNFSHLLQLLHFTHGYSLSSSSPNSTRMSSSTSSSSSSSLSSFPFSKIIPLILLLIASVSNSFVATAQGTGTNETLVGHRCYVCLPADKSSHEAAEILSLFPPEQHYNIPDCIAFGPHNAHQFEFTCPEKYVGCLRRALGNNRALVSRTCVNLAINDCKVANAVEYCYCSGPLCNGEKNYTSTDDTNGYWNKDITDDEDLLGPNLPEEGSGEGEGEEEVGEESSSSSSVSKSGDNSRNPLKPSSSQEQFSPTGRRTHSGSSIPASSNKGTRKDALPTNGASLSPPLSPLAVLLLVPIVIFSFTTTFSRLL